LVNNLAKADAFYDFVLSSEASSSHEALILSHLALLAHHLTLAHLEDLASKDSTALAKRTSLSNQPLPSLSPPIEPLLVRLVHLERAIIMSSVVLASLGVFLEVSTCDDVTIISVSEVFSAI